jgi:SagB-type dehydrogenase family enzyme
MDQDTTHTDHLHQPRQSGALLMEKASPPLEDAARLRQAIAAVRQPTADPLALDVRVRRSRALVVVLEAQGLVVYNYLNNACEDCPPTALDLLRAADDWTHPAALVAQTAADGDPAETTARLIELGFLVVAETEAARRDVVYEEEWAWDVRAGLFHLAIKDPPFMTTEEQLDDLEARVDEQGPIPLYTTNADCSTVLELPRPSLDAGPFPLLARRRTFRTFADAPVRLEALRDCLYAGLGITGFQPEPVKGMGQLPLKMTPSGGARNPFEAYVWVGRVEGAPPGFYHYSAVDGTLGLVAEPPLPRPSELLCGQDWWDGAGAVVFLVANFRRTMWKYPHPMAYRAVLIEAGHIGQNVMIAATYHGLTAGPTALLRDSLIEGLLGLDRVMQSVVYALVLGVPSEERGVHPPEALRRLKRQG